MTDFLSDMLVQVIFIIGIICCVAVGISIFVNPNNGHYNYAVIYSPSGEIAVEGEIKRYDITGDDLIEVTFQNDVMFMTSPRNIIFKNTDKDTYIYKEGEHDI